MVSLSSTSKRVSWDTILVSESSVYTVQGYTIYYNQTQENRKRQNEEGSLTVTSSEDFVIIEDLEKHRKYQFLVAGVFVLYGDVVIGKRFLAMTPIEVPSKLLIKFCCGI